MPIHLIPVTIKHMVKLVILLRAGKRSETWYEQYNDFLMKLEELPGLRKKAVSSVFGAMGGAMPYSTIIEAYFDDQAALQTALTSQPGGEAGRLLLEFAGPQPTALYVDTLEEPFPRPVSDE